MSCRQRGFTLTELLTVVVIMCVFVSLASVSFYRTRRQRAADRLAATIVSEINIARRRAVARGSRVILDLRPTVVAWCERDPANAAQTTCPTPANTVCQVGPPAVLCESSSWAGEREAMIAGYDLIVNQGAVAAPPVTLPPGGYSIVFHPNGTADGIPATAALDGFTLYLRERPTGVAGPPLKPRKIFLPPAAGRPRVVDRW